MKKILISLLTTVALVFSSTLLAPGATANPYAHTKDTAVNVKKKVNKKRIAIRTVTKAGKVKVTDGKRVVRAGKKKVGKKWVRFPKRNIRIRINKKGNIIIRKLRPKQRAKGLRIVVRQRTGKKSEFKPARQVLRLKKNLRNVVKRK